MTSSLSTVSLEALADELLKIAAETGPAPEQKPGEKFKKWVKNTALIGAGYASGQAVGMLVERAAKKMVGPAWNRWQSPLKSNILRGAASIASIGAILALQEQEREKARRMK